MHPVLLGELAQDHVRSLTLEADAARLARAAFAESPVPGLRRRTGLRLIALGERLAQECPQNVAPLYRTGRV